MNTPTLISILSSPNGATESSRLRQSADPAHGLDFSRLLGEKRSPSVAPAAPQRPSQHNASRAADAQPRANQTAPRQDDTRREASESNSSPAASAPSAPARENASASQQQPANNGSQPDSHAAADTPANGSTPAGETAGQTAANANPAEDGNELAQAAAEAGLPGAPALQALQTAAVTHTQNGGSGHTAPQAGLLPGQASPENTVPAPGAIPAAALEAEPETILPGAIAAQRLLTADAQPAAGAPLQPTATPVTQVQAAVAQAFNGADATPSKAALAAAPSAANLAVDARPVAADAAITGAAALSLQEFTAMVAAARSTSGTTLPGATGPALTGAAPLAPATAMPGLMPAGMLPGQAPGLATPGAGIRAPLGSPQWPTELGRQFISIAQAPNNLGKIAELRLDPPELGPLRITINLNDNVAHAVFSSPHALVRQTVENALPQLQQMLEQAGISLGQANVNDQHSSGQASQDPASQGHQHALASGASEAAGELAEAGSAPARPSNPNALVDTFV